MSLPQTSAAPDVYPQDLSASYQRVRSASTELCRSLEPEDYVVQSMPDVSPTKWHLAHTTWFFERFILVPHATDYRWFNEQFDYLFNSYYYTVGQMHQRPRRGLLTRPTVNEVMDYRSYVDERLVTLLGDRPDDPELSKLITIGLNHEQQHQELMLTDIKHVLSQNPLLPAFKELPTYDSAPDTPLAFRDRAEGLYEIGTSGDDEFCFDNETPRHREFVESHAIATRLITNAEYKEFMRDNGYGKPELWLSDGWAMIQTEGWDRPLYWTENCEQSFTLGGLRPLADRDPVCHLSYYEADAFARWAQARLPTEAEWEICARELDIAGNFVEEGWLNPIPASGRAPVEQVFGDVWEWTQSPYTAYPGFRPLDGSLGEYNGKFMCNQLVLRGGSCATPADHVRATYRNFFYPHSRWQFSGIRLARD